MVLKAFTKATPVVHITKDKSGHILYVRLGKYKGTHDKKVLVQFEKDIIEGVDMDDLWPVYNDDDVKVEIIERIFHELWKRRWVNGNVRKNKKNKWIGLSN